jgi:hypothetical protein
MSTRARLMIAYWLDGLVGIVTIAPVFSVPFVYSRFAPVCFSHEQILRLLGRDVAIVPVD